MSAHPFPISPCLLYFILRRPIQTSWSWWRRRLRTFLRARPPRLIRAAVLSITASARFCGRDFSLHLNSVRRGFGSCLLHGAVVSAERGFHLSANEVKKSDREIKRRTRNQIMNINRKNFIEFGLLSFAGFIGAPACFGGKSRGRSWYKGVEVGCITYGYRSMPCDAASVIRYAVESGLGTLELMGDVVDRFVGTGAKRDTAKLPVLKKMFDDTGVSLHIVKYGAIGNGNDKEDEYRIAAAKARSTTTRRSTRLPTTATARLFAQPDDQFRRRTLRCGDDGRQDAIHRSARVRREAPRPHLLDPPQGPHDEGERREEPGVRQGRHASR